MYINAGVSPSSSIWRQMSVRIVRALYRIGCLYWALVCILLSPAIPETPILASCLFSELSLCSLGQSLFGTALNPLLLHRFERDQRSLSMQSIVRNVWTLRFSYPTSHVLSSCWKVLILSFQYKISCIPDIHSGRLRMSCWALVFYPCSMSGRIVSSTGDGLWTLSSNLFWRV